MPIHRRVSGVWRQVKPWLKDPADSTWKPVNKVWEKIAGVWTEVYPNIPDMPVVTVNPIYRNDQIEVDASWTNPGGTAQTRFNVRLAFVNRQTGVVYRYTSYVTLDGSTLAYTFDNGGVGWQGYALSYNVRAEVIPYSGNTAVGFYAGPVGFSVQKQVIQLPAPPAPTSWNINIQASAYSSTWAYTATNRATKFEIQTWLSGDPITTYNVPITYRSWATEPWNPATVGRETVNSRIRAVGPGGASAWVTESGIMPGPVSLTDVRFEGGRLKVRLSGNTDGVHVYAQRLESELQWDLSRYTNATPVDYIWSDSINLTRDGEFRYRFVFKPETASGWTGRNQVSGWCIKMPNPIYYRPNQTLSLRGGKTWFTSSDGRHVYQGEEPSGYSTGAYAWYGAQMYYDFRPARIGYATKATQMHVAMRRYAVGGAGGGARLSFYVHNQPNYNGQVPSAGDQEYGKYLVWNESAWCPLPLKYWDYWTSNNSDWHGLAVWSGEPTEYMILWRHLSGSGNLDGHAFWTIKVVHDG